MEISKYPARRSVFRFVAFKSKRPRLHDTNEAIQKNPACGRQAGMENNLSYETKKLNKNE